MYHKIDYINKYKWFTVLFFIDNPICQTIQKQRWRHHLLIWPRNMHIHEIIILHLMKDLIYTLYIMILDLCLSLHGFILIFPNLMQIQWLTIWWKGKKCKTLLINIMVWQKKKSKHCGVQVTLHKKEQICIMILNVITMGWMWKMIVLNTSSF